MESHQFFRHGGVTGAGSSYFSSCPIAPSTPDRLFGSLKFAMGNSHVSDSDSILALSDGQDLSGSSPSCSLSIESNVSFSRLNPPLLQDASFGQDIKRALLYIETALMSPYGDEEDISIDDMTDGVRRITECPRLQMSGSLISAWIQDYQGCQAIQPRPSGNFWRVQPAEDAVVDEHKKGMEKLGLQSISSGNLKQLLITCAYAVSENNMNGFYKLIEKVRAAVSISGDPIQRVGAYLVEGLVARNESSGNDIYSALRCREPLSKDLLSYMQILYNISPYLKFGYMAANGAIAELCKNENRIHIIDFQIAQGTQWISLLQALAAKPGGAPNVRITGIEDPVNKQARGNGLESVRRRLAVISETFGIPVEFRVVPVYAPDVSPDMFDVRPGEALAVNFPLQLHHIPDESVDVSNPRDSLLRMVKSLNPKVVTLVEQESNTNTTPFLTRFIETLDFYLAMFESIDMILPRDQKDRIGVEQHCLGKDIVNMIACEGKQRVERHELFGKWKVRLSMAGFRQYPMSSYINSVMRSLLRCYSEHYTLLEEDGATLLGWKNRNLISASAWH